MLIKHYFHPVFCAISATVILLLMAVTYGQGLVFDSIASVAFILVAFFFKEDKDIMGVCIILAIVNISINAIFIFTVDNYFCRVLGYLFAIISMIYFYSDKQFRIITFFLLVSLTSEIYWYFIGYDGPEIYFSFVKISIYVAAKFFLLYRSMGSSSYLKTKAAPIRLDWYANKILSMTILIEIFYLIEYLLRHLTTLKPVLLYHLYPFIAQAISAYYIWLIVNQANMLFRQRSITI